MPSDLLLEPLITPTQFLLSKPFSEATIFGISFIVIVPSSTLFVFLLGFQTMFLGYTFLRNYKNEKNLWWGITFLFWGLGALLAGTSYQGLGYELKCNVDDYCLFTSWFELAYLYFTAISIGSMAIAISKTLLPINKQKLLINYSYILTILYTIILVVGSVFSVRFLISYELFTIFFMPLFVVFFIISIFGYKENKDALNKTLIITWILFLFVNLSYYVYYFLGLTEFLYDNYNIWFSANDVLHIGLIGWMLVIQITLKKRIE
jgi:hypothetical protein